MGWLVTIHTMKHISAGSVSTPCMLRYRVDVTGRGTSVRCSQTVEVTVTLITVLLIHQRLKLNHSNALSQSRSGRLSESPTFHGGFDSRWPHLGSTRQGTRGKTVEPQHNLWAPSNRLLPCFKALFRQRYGLLSGTRSSKRQELQIALHSMNVQNFLLCKNTSIGLTSFRARIHVQILELMISFGRCNLKITCLSLGQNKQDDRRLSSLYCSSENLSLWMQHSGSQSLLDSFKNY